MLAHDLSNRTLAVDREKKSRQRGVHDIIVSDKRS